MLTVKWPHNMYKCLQDKLRGGLVLNNAKKLNVICHFYDTYSQYQAIIYYSYVPTLQC
jgi:hypothetical protein